MLSGCCEPIWGWTAEGHQTLYLLVHHTNTHARHGRSEGVTFCSHFVRDGCPLPSKAATNAARLESRTAAREAAARVKPAMVATSEAKLRKDYRPLSRDHWSTRLVGGRNLRILGHLQGLSLYMRPFKSLGHTLVYRLVWSHITHTLIIVTFTLTFLHSSHFILTLNFIFTWQSSYALTPSSSLPLTVGDYDFAITEDQAVQSCVCLLYVT